MKYILILFILISDLIYGYIGPGMSSGLIATIIGILGSLLLAIFGIVYYPIKRILKKRQKK